MHIYFSGIGGLGIGPLAFIAQDQGYEVSGSDVQESSLTKLVEARGIRVSIDQTGEQIANVHAHSPIDWVVFSSSLPQDHPELMFAREHNIKLTKRDEFTNFVIEKNDLKLVAISGTHGKTTTTSMLIWLTHELKQPISYSVGATLSFGAYAQLQQGSKYFIYECDEYDRNFLAYHPYLGVITSVDYDHPDTYPAEKDYREAFKQFTDQCEHLVIWEDDQDKLDSDPSKAETLSYKNVPDRQQLPLAGEHKRQNAYLALIAYRQLTELKQPDDNELLEILAGYPGADRRFELLASKPSGGQVYSDYGHHPKEIKSTLQMASELSDNVVVVYQPHQNLRQHTIADIYKDSFNQAKRVFWLPTYLTREDSSLPTLSREELIQKLDNPNIAEPADLNDELVKKVEAELDKGALVIFMGAGSIDDWARTHFS
ncbi:MAG TPA: Mur ligase domain-containing protein [Candidatus Saccharimonadales bacterium]